MDKLVDRVTVVQGSGETETLYDAHHEEHPTIPIDEIVRSVTVVDGPGRVTVVHRSPNWPESRPTFQINEDSIRRFLKADMIRAQEAYRNHKDSASGDKQLWWLDLPANMIRAFITAGREAAAESRAKEARAEAGEDDIRAKAADLKSDVKAKAADLKSKAKGA